MSKYYQLYCEICNWKRITDGTDIGDLYEYKKTSIPGGVPKLDPVTKKIVTPKAIETKRKFRCPQCGRTVIAKPAANPQEKVDAHLAEIERKEMAEKWAEEDARFRAEYEAAKRLYDEENRTD